MDGSYVVHELRFPSDPPDGDETLIPLDAKELPGRNILQDQNGSTVWTSFFSNDGISVSAAPIFHSVPCVGYVINEAPAPMKMNPALYIPRIKQSGAPMSVLGRLQRGEDVTLPDGSLLQGLQKIPGRKVVILGDTYDASPISSMAENADILVHEATNAHLPGIDPGTKAEDTYASVEVRSRSRGHSTPQVAGRFATLIKARRLVLNHFSPRYKGNDDVDTDAARVMDAIKGLAQQEYNGEVTCARDLMSIEIELVR